MVAKLDFGGKTPDFDGWATKTGIECSDGRVIMDGAFSHQDGQKVPLVYAHNHDEPTNVVGHAFLEKRPEGVYAYGFFNGTGPAQHLKEALAHGDLDALSIFANKLRERGSQVMHGFIKELSLVLSGANPGAKIENVSFAHGDTLVEIDDEVYIEFGIPLDNTLAHADGAGSSDTVSDETVGDIYAAFSEKQKAVVHFMIGSALEEAGVVAHSDEDGDAVTGEDDDEESDDDTDETEDDGDDESTDDNTEDDKSKDDTAGDDTSTDDKSSTNSEGTDLAHKEGTSMNAFQHAEGESGGGTLLATDIDRTHALKHDDLVKIVAHAKQVGSFKEAVLAHAEEYGITDINLLFPDAKVLETTPQFISRRMEWVSVVLGGTKHTPFAKVKTLLADITEPEARAKGYLKGNRKKEEVFKLLKRTTGPGTIYKKQKLDRDDMLDITEIDIVNWLKAEMRLMTEEELARAVLVGDGRSSLSDDKVKDPEGAPDGDGIRSIMNDDELYAIHKELPANTQPKDSVKGVIRFMDEYRGSGSPTMFIGRSNLTELLLDEDRFGRPLYANRQALADKVGVDRIVTVDLFSEYEGLYAIIVNLNDYSIGTNRGGELTSFEDFDIDFNQYKYLMETRLSGGLTKPFSAIVIMKQMGTLATATAPSFDGNTNTVTIPTITGVSYFNSFTNTEVTPGDHVITEETNYQARPDEGYYLATAVTKDWTFAP